MVIRVAVVDNHEVVRKGLASQLADQPDLQLVATVATTAELDGADVGADVVVLDLWLDDGDSITHIPALVAAGAAVLLYTSEERPVPLRNAVAAGAAGLLLKSDPLDTVPDGIRRAAAGEFCCSGPLAHALLTDANLVARLTPRQIDILRGLDDGLSYRSIARLLQISEGSIKTHLARARQRYRDVGIEPSNSIDMVRLAKTQGHLAD